MAVVAVIAISAFTAYYLFSKGSGCSAPTEPEGARYQASKIQFGAVTEYCIANPLRSPNGVVVGPDGSVWFGEQALPGLGRLFPNGTVQEYLWPGASSTINGYQAGIWGMLFWNGMVWGANLDDSYLAGVNPTIGATEKVNATGAGLPYLLATSPDGSMWFTSLQAQARLGKVSPDLKETAYEVVGVGKNETIQVQFVNSTLAYMVALNPQSGTGQGGLYWFDPQTSNGTIVAHRAGGNFSLFFPDGLSVSSTGAWVSQHLPANVAGYDFRSGEWTIYPTSTVPYESTTLPYFIQVSPTSPNTVWFNEHYGNRIALLNASAGTLTEYSEADPPITTGSQIQNDLTIAATSSGVWFTSTTGNYIGFVDGSYHPRFSISVLGSNETTLAPGGSTTASLAIRGSWASALNVNVSDSERFSSIPELISIRPSSTSLPSGSGPVSLSAEIRAGQSLAPGRYTLAVDVSDGPITQSAYIFLTVT